MEHRVQERTAEIALRNEALAGEVEVRKSIEHSLRVIQKEREALLVSEQEARAESEHASRMKDEFVATLSHELRTPISAILGWVQQLRKGDSSHTDHALEVIERNTRIQAKMIEDLLDMSRIISGKMRLDVQTLDLPSIIGAAIDAVTPAAEAKGVRVQQVLDPRAEPVKGDPNRMQQVVWNLLANAIKFTSRGGRVHVSLQRINSHIEITVSDTGKGIAKEFYARSPR